MDHVILGAGPAGIVAAETIRKHDPQASITVLGGEPEQPYARMAIPYVLEGKIAEDGTLLRKTPNHYDNLGITFRHAVAAGLDTTSKRVQLTHGGEQPYDSLLIATGARPVRPPIDGLDTPGVHTCWTLSDARAIAERAGKGDPVLLIGAGFIGSIILEALVLRGVDLTVVEMGDHMVPRMLDETAGGMLKQWCTDKGVQVLTGTTVTEIMSDSSDILSVNLSSGETVNAKLVVVAAGVQSNIGFLKGSGLDMGTGIKVNEHLAANAPDVYAAGDVAEAKNFQSGGYNVLAVQPVAVEHGYIAGLNMTGKPTAHRGSLNMNVLDTLGLISSSFGAWHGVEGGDSARTQDASNWRYLRLEFDGDHLVGGQALGMTDHIGMMRGLIQSRLRLGAWKDKLLKSPERLAEAYVATAQGL